MWPALRRETFRPTSRGRHGGVEVVESRRRCRRGIDVRGSPAPVPAAAMYAPARTRALTADAQSSTGPWRVRAERSWVDRADGENGHGTVRADRRAEASNDNLLVALHLQHAPTVRSSARAGGTRCSA